MFIDILENRDGSEEKAFLRSFIKKIVVDDDEGRIAYKFPVLPSSDNTGKIVLPTEKFCGAEGTRTPDLPDENRDTLFSYAVLPGGAEGTIGRTFKLTFALTV